MPAKFITAAAIILALATPRSSAFALPKIKVKRGGLHISVPEVGSGRYDPRNSAVQINRIGDVQYGETGVRVNVPGAGRVEYQLGNGRVDVEGFGSGSIDSNGVIRVDIQGESCTVERNGIRTSRGDLRYNIAPDGSFKPAHWTDEDWAFAKDPTARNFQKSFESNKDDILRQLQGKWNVFAPGAEIDWEEYQSLAIAVGAAIATQNPVPVKAYLIQLRRRMIDEFRKNLGQEAETVLTAVDEQMMLEALHRAVNGGLADFPPLRSASRGAIKVQLGVVTFAHRKKFAFDYLEVTTGKMRRWESVEPGPNTYLPFLGINFGDHSATPDQRPTLGIDFRLVPLFVEVADGRNGIEAKGIELTKVYSGYAGDWHGLVVEQIVVAVNKERFESEEAFLELVRRTGPTLMLDVLDPNTAEVFEVPISRENLLRSRPAPPQPPLGNAKPARILVTKLVCSTPEDDLADGDEAVLSITIDGKTQKVLSQQMAKGSQWTLNLVIEFNERVTLDLVDDDSGDLIGDDDYLGQVSISRSALTGTGSFRNYGANYTLWWQPAR